MAVEDVADLPHPVHGYAGVLDEVQNGPARGRHGVVASLGPANERAGVAIERSGDDSPHSVLAIEDHPGDLAPLVQLLKRDSVHMAGHLEDGIGARIHDGSSCSKVFLTELRNDVGEEHLRTGRPIVYTSADTVFQVACHVHAVPLEQLYEWCKIARVILDGEHRVGRVIARPFDGDPGSFVRRPERRDYSVPPPGRTVLDFIKDAGIPVYGVGKIRDIFDGHGLSEFSYSDSNDHGIELSIDFLRRPGASLVFTNLVDFDSKFGHRNDPQGYGRCIEALDRRIPELVNAVGDGLMLITGDHGCDPTDTSSTDHTREYTPVLVVGARTDAAIDLGIRQVFGDVGATVAQVLGVDTNGLAGTSFADELGLSD